MIDLQPGKPKAGASARFVAMMSLALFLLMHVCGTCFASVLDSLPQSHVSKAASLCQQMMFDEALAELDVAASAADAESDEYYWYVRGFVYKEIYKNREASVRNSSARESAVKSFLRLHELQQNSKNQFAADAAIQFLAMTYYNDALMSAMDFTMINREECDGLFMKYRELDRLNNEVSDWQTRLADFSRAKGMRFFSLWQNQQEEIQIFNLAMDAMDQSLELNPSDCNTRYNQAVANYEMAKYKSGDDYLIRATEQLHAAEQICPDHAEILRGLLNIYKLKNETELIRFYENRIAELAQRNNQVKN